MFQKYSTMMQTTRQYLLSTLCCAMIISLLAACNTEQTTQPSSKPTQQATTASSLTCATHSTTPVTLSMYYGSEKQAWMEDVVADFNSRHITACDGPVTVEAVPIGSGDSMQQILDGKIQPDIWSPAGNVWLSLLNASWQQQHPGQSLIGTGATDVVSLVTSPVVIAMWKPEAEALGWPNKPIGWGTIDALSTNPQGWAAYGHPEFGDFKFGHTHPDASNSGLDAIIAENYAATHKQKGLTSADVTDPHTRDFVANVESSVIHYGDSTGFFADKMFGNGPSYLSAAVMYENLVIQANDGKTYPHLPYPVVAIYPDEGTFYSDHPFTTLQANWVTPAKKAAAQVFRDFLLAPEQQRKAMHYGFRPADLRIPLAAPLDKNHGIDPSQPQATLQVPPADVINAIKTSWNQQRRKVDVMLILDRSGSMNDAVNGVSKIDAAKQGMAEFVNLLGDNDSLGLTVFSDRADALTPTTALGPKRQRVLQQINGIIADGNTRLFNTIAEQVATLQAAPSKHIKAVVVLTDGQDNYNLMTLDQLVSKVTPAGDDKNAGEGVKVFTIAYGTDADANALTKIASASGGQEYPGTPQNIRAVYQQISQFF